MIVLGFVFIIENFVDVIEVLLSLGIHTAVLIFESFVQVVHHSFRENVDHMQDAVDMKTNGKMGSAMNKCDQF